MSSTRKIVGVISTAATSIVLPVYPNGLATLGLVLANATNANFKFEASLDSTNGTDGTWVDAYGARSNGNTIENTTGAISASPAYTWDIPVANYTFLRITGTAGITGAITATFTARLIEDVSEPMPTVQINGTATVSGTVTANIGTGSLAAGTNLIGDVGGQYRANATGAASIKHIVSGASTNATNVKASAGRVVGWSLVNTTASLQYVKLHNNAGTPTAGAGVVQTIAIPANGVNNMPLGYAGVGFSTGIAFTIVTGSADADATATTAGSVIGDIFYA